jgi:hypothetical protein
MICGPHKIPMLARAKHFKSIVFMTPNESMMGDELKRRVWIHSSEGMLGNHVTVRVAEGQRTNEGEREAEFTLKSTDTFLKVLVAIGVNEIPDFRGQVARHGTSEKTRFIYLKSRAKKILIG